MEDCLMKKNSFIYEDYPPEWTLGLPAKWIFVAEDMLDEDLFKEWLFYAMRYYGFCGTWRSDNAYVNMLLDAVYDEDEQFFDQYCFIEFSGALTTPRSYYRIPGLSGVVILMRR